FFCSFAPRTGTPPCASFSTARAAPIPLISICALRIFPSFPVHGGKYARTVRYRMRAAFDFSAPPASDGICQKLHLYALALDAHNVAEDDKIARFVFAERERRAADKVGLPPAADDNFRLRKC